MKTRGHSLGLGLGLAPLVLPPANNFDPSQLTNLSLWLKGDAGVHLTSGAIDTWTDQSSNAFSFTQATAANRPAPGTSINGRATIDCSVATAQFLTIAGGHTYGDVVTAAAYTQFAVWLYTGSSVDAAAVYNDPSVFADSNQDIGMPIALLSSDHTKLVVNAYQFSGGIVKVATGAGNNVLASAAHKHTVQLAGGNLSLRVDGAAIGSTACGNVGAGDLAANFTIGGNLGGLNNWVGSVGEVIFYNRALTLGEIAQVEAYLHTRWGT